MWLKQEVLWRFEVESRSKTEGSKHNSAKPTRHLYIPPPFHSATFEGRAPQYHRGKLFFESAYDTAVAFKPAVHGSNFEGLWCTARPLLRAARRIIPRHLAQGALSVWNASVTLYTFVIRGIALLYPWYVRCLLFNSIRRLKSKYARRAINIPRLRASFPGHLTL